MINSPSPVCYISEDFYKLPKISYCVSNHPVHHICSPPNVDLQGHKSLNVQHQGDVSFSMLLYYPPPLAAPNSKVRIQANTKDIFMQLPKDHS